MKRCILPSFKTHKRFAPNQIGTPSASAEKEDLPTSTCYEKCPNNISQSTCTNNLTNNRTFTVVWGKPSKKKHKTWEGDGKITVSSRLVTLYDEDGKEIGQSGLSDFTKNKINEDEIIYVGSKMVQILSEESSEPVIVKTTDSSPNLISTCSNYSKHPINNCVRKPLNKLTKPFNYLNAKANSFYKMPNPSLLCQWEHNQELLSLTDVLVDSSLETHLRPHQKEGIEFLYKCMLGFQTGRDNIWYYGAILADEMGLGKTLQCITLIHTIIKHGPYGGKPLIKKFLIVTPSSLVDNWHKEFDKWLNPSRLKIFYVGQKHKPSEMPAFYHGMIISYDMLVRSYENINLNQFDLVVCDEGHRIKNNQIKLSMVLSQLKCKRRIILTGTPLQNNLPEFCSLSNFVNPGILGNEEEFKSLMDDDNFYQITNLFLLRRTQEVIKRNIPSKTESIIFCRATNCQVQLYNHLIDCSGVINHETGDITNYLSVVMNLRKVCNDPRLVACGCESFITDYVDEDSVKYQVIAKLLVALYKAPPSKREKVVLVSNFTQTLDLLENMCHSYSYNYLRFDGSVNISKRSTLVSQFNTDPNIFLMLLSSKAGGMGLNLTGGSQIILYDIDWNPAIDLQSMNRIWREGQSRPCFIYRLIVAGTIEEKIFLRQMNKANLSSQLIDEKLSNQTFNPEEYKDICEKYIATDCLTHDHMECDCLNGNPSDKANIDCDVNYSKFQIQITKKPNNSAFNVDKLLKWNHSTELPSDLKQYLENASSYISFVMTDKN